MTASAAMAISRRSTQRTYHHRGHRDHRGFYKLHRRGAIGHAYRLFALRLECELLDRVRLLAFWLAPQLLHIEVEDRRDIERQRLREDQTADDGQTEWTP